MSICSSGRGGGHQRSKAFTHVEVEQNAHETLCQSEQNAQETVEIGAKCSGNCGSQSKMLRKLKHFGSVQSTYSHSLPPFELKLLTANTTTESLVQSKSTHL